MLSLTDIYATISALINRDLGEKEGEDSYNLLPLFLNPESEAIRVDLVNHSCDGVFAFRQDNWKLIPDELGSGSPYSQPQSK